MLENSTILQCKHFTFMIHPHAIHAPYFPISWGNSIWSAQPGYDKDTAITYSVKQQWTATCVYINKWLCADLSTTHDTKDLTLNGLYMPHISICVGLVILLVILFEHSELIFHHLHLFSVGNWHCGITAQWQTRLPIQCPELLTWEHYDELCC